jgi:putative hydrolase of the HAD superfamily
VPEGPSRPPVDAVIFDWGGTLTPWVSVDFDEEARALAAAVPEAGPETFEVLREANQAVWTRSKDEHVSATVSDIFAAAGLVHDDGLLTAYREFWEPATHTDPDVPALFEWLRARDIRVGVLSNTVWPRAWHEGFFARDGVLDLIDGAVYTSEVPWTKPAPEAFRAAMAAVGVGEARRCAFVGDRLFDDIWGAARVGMRTIHVPHSVIPVEQHGHIEGEPDAVVHRLAEIPTVLTGWA